MAECRACRIALMVKRKVLLTTIGYEGASLEAFVDTLKEAGVTMLLDVRELPSSRRKGFSKTLLSEILREAGIEYRHERALGTPRNLRNAYRKHGDIDRYFGEFRKYLATQAPLLDEIAPALTGRVALMCFERDPAECHRSIVAPELAQRLQTTVNHLSVPGAG